MNKLINIIGFIGITILELLTLALIFSSFVR
jgi:hypothetical protein